MKGTTRSLSVIFRVVLETAYREARESLRAAQRRQKDCYDKGVKHMVFRTGDLVLRYTPQLRPSEANKFHPQWEGPFEVVERVTAVTCLVKKVRGRSRRSQVVHFNNLRLYQKRQEAPLEEPVAGASVDVPQGGSEESERVAPAGGEVEPVEPGTKRQLLKSLYGGQFTLSTPLIKPNFCILLPHRRSTIVSLETTPFIH